jgi:hypothetical protein
MPYKIRKRGAKFQLVNADTGKIYGTHTTKKKAEAQKRLIGGVTHGMILRGKK